jgi:hypothetical protein
MVKIKGIKPFVACVARNQMRKRFSSFAILGNKQKYIQKRPE